MNLRVIAAALILSGLATSAIAQAPENKLLVDLSGEWQFLALGEQGCKITLRLDFDFRRGLVSAAFQRGFARIADHMVQEFCQRADDILANPAAGGGSHG